jgi:hypothetical protein
MLKIATHFLHDVKIIAKFQYQYCQGAPIAQWLARLTSERGYRVRILGKPWMFFVQRKNFIYESTPHFLWRPFLKESSKYGQCQLMVINNDNINNGRYENNHFRPVVLITQKNP